MAAKKYPRVLYFVAGNKPSDEDMRNARQYGPGVLFRNATRTPADGPMEPCDIATGPAVPERYAEAFGENRKARNPAKHANDIARGATPRSVLSPGEGGWSTTPKT